MRKNQLAIHTPRHLTTNIKLEPNMDIVLADCSGSMSTHIGPTVHFGEDTRPTKFDCLKMALTGRSVGVIGFADTAAPIDIATATHDGVGLGYGTNLVHALDEVVKYEPLHILVVCDGRPNDPSTPLAQAARISLDAIIDTLFIGDSTDTIGKDFMRALAEAGRGRYREFDIVAAAQPKQLTSIVAGLLAGPQDTKIEL